MISIIVACDENLGIGKDGKIPWYNQKDMEFFKESTMDRTVVMGRKTWKSLNYKELKGRENVILSHDILHLSMSDVYNNVKTFRTIEFICEYYNNNFVVIGGQQIYKEFLERDLVDHILLTAILCNYDCDTFFPDLDENKWHVINTVKLDLVTKVIHYERTR